MSMCPNCNKELNEGITVCDGCGTEIVEESVTAPVTEALVPEEPIAEPPEEKKLPKMALILGGIGAVAIAVVVLLIIAISALSGSGKSAENYALYLKDSEIFFSDLKKDGEVWQLTNRLVDSDDLDDEDMAEAGYMLGMYTHMSEDGKYIFFPDKIGDEDEGFNLYYRETTSESEAIKVDSDVRRYTVNTSAKIVTYIKGEDGNLYQYKLGDDSKDKVASELSDFYVTDKADKIVYLNTEGGLYLKHGEEDKEKIAGDVASIKYVSEDCSTVYYLKDDALYKWVEGEDSVKIASDVYSVIKIYDSGEIYYTREMEAVSLIDYVLDDMNIADVAMVEPEYPDYPSAPADYPYSWEYDTYAEYEAAYEAYEKAYEDWSDECERMEDEYDAAMEAYWEKAARDELREDLKDETMEDGRYTLYYYDGKEAVALTEDFASIYSYEYTVASDAPVISYEAYNRMDLSKVKLSEIDSLYDVKELIEDALFSSKERYIAVKGNATVIEQEKEADCFAINASGTIVYYIDDVPEDKNYGSLYCLSISKDGVGKPELYDEDVSTSYSYFMNDSDFVYFKDFKSGKGELYINKNKIDYDVYAYSVSHDSDSGNVFYFADWNDDKEYGTLKVYNGKESSKIADDVHKYTMTPDGQILYLYDYSLNYCKGELHQWSKGDTRKIDDDVVCVLPFYTAKYRGD